jgi:hypothetical protein
VAALIIIIIPEWGQVEILNVIVSGPVAKMLSVVINTLLPDRVAPGAEPATVQTQAALARTTRLWAVASLRWPIRWAKAARRRAPLSTTLAHAPFGPVGWPACCPCLVLAVWMSASTAPLRPRRMSSRLSVRLALWSLLPTGPAQPGMVPDLPAPRRRPSRPLRRPRAIVPMDPMQCSVRSLRGQNCASTAQRWRRRRGRGRSP